MIEFDSIPVPQQPRSIPGQMDLFRMMPGTADRPTNCAEEGNEKMPATATPPKSKAQDSKTLEAKSTPAEVTNGIVFIEQDVEVALIDPRPDQPRKDFDPIELQSLADSIAEVGLGQRIIVRRVGPRFELVAGERRLRAFKLLGRKTIPSRIVSATHEQLHIICLVENLQRVDLSAIEEANAYQEALATLKCTQVHLAKRLGMTQAQVSNTIRLLKAPASVQAALISREIDRSTVRDSVAWCDLPGVSSLLDELVETMRKESPIDNDSFEQAVNEACRKASRPVNAPYWETGKPTLRLDVDELPPNVLKNLQIRDVPDYVGGMARPRAFNLPLWSELAVDNSAKTKEQADDDETNDEGDGETEAEPKMTAAEKAEAKQRRAECLEQDLADYLIRWHWRMVSQFIPNCDESVLWRLMCWFARECGNYSKHGGWGSNEELAAIIEKHGGRVVALPDGDVDLWTSMATVKHPVKVAAMMLSLRAFSESEGCSTDAELRVLLQIVAEMGIKLSEHWSCDEDFLGQHEVPELVAMCLEWKRKGPGPSVSEREALIAWMIEENGRKAFPVPKSLSKLKLPLKRAEDDDE